MNYNELSKRVHELFVKNGRVYQDNEYRLMLIIKDVGDAALAYVSDRRMDNDDFKEFYKGGGNICICFYDTLEELFAQIVLRLLDWAGGRGVTFAEYEGEDVDFDFENPSFMGAAYRFVSRFLCGHTITGTNYYFKAALHYMEQWAKHLDIDLEWFVAAKMAYNESINGISMDEEMVKAID